MAWIKRNLIFLIISVVGVLLLGGAGYYLYVKKSLNSERIDQFNSVKSDAENLVHANVTPGDGKKVDNIKAAKDNAQQLRGFISRAQKSFEPIPAIPSETNFGPDIFAAQLRSTIDGLQQQAAAASVALPPRYDFAFSSIKTKITFAAGSLAPWSEQLGEIKAMCDVLFAAKINSLDGIRRERASSDDKEAADYIELHSVTNDLAVLSPYEITFRSFSGELAGVLSGLANSRHCFRVRNISIEPSGQSIGTMDAGIPAAVPRPMIDSDAAPAAQPVAAPVAAAPVLHGGLPTVVNEHLLKVTMLVEVVKLKLTGN